MIQDFTKRGVVVRAALRLAETRGWTALSMPEIADAAGISLVELKGLYDEKRKILKDFVRMIDDVVLSGPVDPTESPRERLFDVLMRRFEAMEPYKPALRRIREDYACRPAGAAKFVKPFRRAHYWMLAVAGIEADGPYSWRVTGLMWVTANVMPVWLKDQDPGLAKTMAALDRELNKAEQAAECIGAVCSAFDRLADAFGRRERSGTAGRAGETSGAA